MWEPDSSRGRIQSCHAKGKSVRATIKRKIKGTIAMSALLPLLTLLQPNFAATTLQPNQPANNANMKDNVVYMCVHPRNKSCSCGTKGAPPMKAVPRNSAWVDAHRDAVAN